MCLFSLLNRVWMIAWMHQWYEGVLYILLKFIRKKLLDFMDFWIMSLLEYNHQSAKQVFRKNSLLLPSWGYNSRWLHSSSILPFRLTFSAKTLCISMEWWVDAPWRVFREANFNLWCLISPVPFYANLWACAVDSLGGWFSIWA